MKEAALVAKIKAHLKANGFWCVKLHGGPTQQAGLPDLLAVKGGRAWFFEVKSGRGPATKIQEHTLRELARYGALVAVVRSVEEVELILNAWER